MPSFILLVSFLAAVFGGSLMALSTDSPLFVGFALLFACACGATGSRFALIADQRKTLRDIRNGTVKLLADETTAPPIYSLDV